MPGEEIRRRQLSKSILIAMADGQHRHVPFGLNYNCWGLMYFLQKKKGKKTCSILSLVLLH